MSQGGSKKKIANSLVAMSSAAVLAVYAAGYTRTRAAANKLDAQAAERRPPSAPARTPAVIAEVRTAEPVAAPARVTEGHAPPPTVPATLVEAPMPTATALPAAVTPQPAEQKVEVTATLPAVVTIAPPPAAAAPAQAPSASPSATWKDGTYLGWGSSRHGDIQAAVVVENGHIASATIAQCLTRYSCSVIEKLPPEVAQRQSPEVDYVSGATQSTNAFYYAVVEALSKAK
jgi:uncharacterized protein with FMN-binding domain